jgi:RNA-binding motif protein, X-linked 2
MLIYGLDRYVRYGEVVDVNLPRDKETGKTKGFGFVMYEDQRSTILAVDNLNGANVLDRTLRVDHVKKYKQARVKGDDGEWKEREEQSLNAKPEMIGECPALPRPIFLARLYTLFSR